MITLAEAAQRLRDARQDVYSGGSKRVNGWAAAADELDRMAAEDPTPYVAPPAASGGKVAGVALVDLKAGMSVAIRVDPASGQLWVEPEPPGNKRGALWAVLASAWDQGYAEHAGDQPRDAWPNPYREAVQ